MKSSENRLKSNIKKLNSFDTVQLKSWQQCDNKKQKQNKEKDY